MQQVARHHLVQVYKRPLLPKKNAIEESRTSQAEHPECSGGQSILEKLNRPAPVVPPPECGYQLYSQYHRTQILTMIRSMMYEALNLYHDVCSVKRP